MVRLVKGAMTRTLFLLAVAAFVFMIVGVIAALLKITAALAVVAVGGLAILSVAVWLLIRTSGDRAAAG